MKKEITAPATKFNVLNNAGYFSRHFELCKTMNGEDAFDEVEKEFKAKTEKNRYKSYDSFRNAKSAFFGNKKNR